MTEAGSSSGTLAEGKLCLRLPGARLRRTTANHHATTNYETAHDRAEGAQ